MGKKSREVMAKAREAFEAGCRTLRLRAGARQAAVRRHRAVRRLRVQQEPHLRLRPRHLPDGVPQGALPGRVLRLPADRASRATSTRRRSTSPTPRGAGIKVLTPDVNRSVMDFADGHAERGRRPTSTLPPGQPGRDHVRAVGDPQRRRGAGRAAARRARRQRAVRSRSTTSPSACPSRCSTSARSSR